MRLSDPEVQTILLGLRIVELSLGQSVMTVGGPDNVLMDVMDLPQVQDIGPILQQGMIDGLCDRVNRISPVELYGPEGKDG